MAENTQFEVLLDVRESQRDEMERKLAEELSEVERRRGFAARKRAALRDAQGDLDALAERRDGLLESDGFQPRQLASLDRHGDTIRARIAELEASLKRALDAVDAQEQEVQRARGELAEAQKGLEAVRKHYEKLQAKTEMVENRKRQAASDEVASRRWWEENK